MQSRYHDLADIEFSKQQMRCMKQHSGESIQTYADRIYELSEHAYDPQELNLPSTNRNLKSVFVAGLKDDSIARLLIKHRPNTLQEAVSMAVSAGQNNRLFQLVRHREEEPMEIGVIDKTPKRDIKVTRDNELSVEVQNLNAKVDQALFEINEVAKVMVEQKGARDQYSFRQSPPKKYRP